MFYESTDAYDAQVRAFLTARYNWSNPALQIDIQPVIRELIDEGYWFKLSPKRVATIIHMEIGQIIYNG